MINFKARYEFLKQAWDENYIDCIKNTSLNLAPPDFQEAVLYSLQAGGKRLRPVMVLEMSELSGIDFTNAMKLAAAVECLHTYSLIHDDLPAMDNDDYRRGMPTSHKKFGEDVAILAGDALQTLSFELISSAGGGDHVIEYFARIVGAQGLIAGQFMDIKGVSENSAQYMDEMHRKKTGFLLSACLVLPYIYKKPTMDFIELEQWGQNLGILFQIVDDILDATSSKEHLGKTIGKDEAQNKLTYVRLYGIEKSRVMAGVLTEKLKNFPQFNNSTFFQDLPMHILHRDM